MADLKRQSAMGGKNTGANSPANVVNPPSLFENTLVGAIGTRVRLTTTLSTIIEGTLFVADPITNLIAINTAPPPPTPSNNNGLSPNSNASSLPGDYHVIPANQITAFKIISLGDSGTLKDSSSSFENAFPKIGAVNLAVAKQREEVSVKKLQDHEKRVGKGVTREAQDIFDALSNTLPSRWHEAEIIVLDRVVISPPYSVNDCKAGEGAATALQQVKKVLGEERKKLADRMGRKGG